MAFWIHGIEHQWRIKGTDIDPLKLGKTITGTGGYLTIEHEGKIKELVLINMETNKIVNHLKINKMGNNSVFEETDQLKAENQQLKQVIRDLIEFGDLEYLEFTTTEDTDKIKSIVQKAKLLLL